VQIIYLDAFGSKSLVRPQWCRFMLEKAPDAVFEIAAAADGVDMQIDTMIFEGLEDLLSGNMLG
jgi:hypothetical protein